MSEDDEEKDGDDKAKGRGSLVNIDIDFRGAGKLADLGGHATDLAVSAFEICLGRPGAAFAKAVSAVAAPFLIRSTEKARVDAEVDRREKIAAVEFFEGVLKDPAAHGVTLQQAHALASNAEDAFERFETLSNVALKAIDHIEPGSTIQPVDPGWARRFRDHAQYATNEELAGLWSRILAEEMTSPGSISPQTMHIIGLVERSDAILFGKLRRTCWDTLGDGLEPIVPTVDGSKWPDVIGMTFIEVMRLEDLGLISYDNGQFHMPVNPGDRLAFGYYGQWYGSDSSEQRRSFQYGPLRFTDPGAQLIKLCAPETEFPGHRERCLQLWQQGKIEFEPIADPR